MQPSEQVVLAITNVDRDIAYSSAGALTELIEPAADAVSIFEDGAQWRVDAYYSETATGQAALDGLTAIYPAVAGKTAINAVPQENWVALSQAALPPVHAGRFTICGSHDLNRVPVGPNTIVVEAGEAFGTAHHATTYGCLLALDRLTRVQSFDRVLDLGTGSGILALALRRTLPRARIVASDIDERSIEVAGDNARRNGQALLCGGPRFVVGDGPGAGGIREDGPFDLIVANILAGPLIGMAPDIVRGLGHGGMLVLSGILVPQAREVCARYVSQGLALRQHDRHNGWSTLTFQRCKRRTSVKAFTLFVPQYD